jgi:hypothetical protein
MSRPSVAVLLLLLLPAVATAGTYENPIHGFALELPPGWVEAGPEVKLEAPPDAPFRFLGALTTGSAAVLDHPYVVLQFTPAPLDRMTLEAFEKQIVTALRRGIPGVASAEWDRDRRRLRMRGVARHAELGPVFSYHVAFPATDGIVQLNAYALQDEFEATVPTFERIAESFRFEEGRAWTPRVADEPGGNDGWMRILVVAGVGAAAGVIVGLLRRRKSR